MTRAPAKATAAAIESSPWPRPPGAGFEDQAVFAPVRQCGYDTSTKGEIIVTYIKSAAAGAILAVVLAAPVAAQERVKGALVERGFLHQQIQPDAIKVFHGSEFKGAHRVAISVFSVAFPNENHFFAAARGGGLGSLMGGGAKASMDTSLSGVDHATRQRIADKAYAAFVTQLIAAGYEIVEAPELAAAAPEYASWPAVPNYSTGRFGTYVAPTGRQLYWLQGDTDKRDTSGRFGSFGASMRVFDTPVAFKRSPYIAHDGKLGIIAVTLVVDYGLDSSNGERKYGKASVGFEPGVNVAAGNAVDHGSLLAFWGPNSGGFPAYAFIQQPIVSGREFATGSAIGEGLSKKDMKDIHAQDVRFVADPAKFEAAADEVVAKAVPALVAAMAAGK